MVYNSVVARARSYKKTEVAVITSSMVKITFVVAEITGYNHFFSGQDHFFSGLDILKVAVVTLLQRLKSLCSSFSQWLTSA